MSNQFPNIIEDLKWRGALSDSTPGAENLLINDKITCYNGFDPTSDSLHIGNLLPLLCLARLQRYGHTPIAILGGGTGMIGDPSGRTDERSLLSIEEIDANGAKIRAQLEQFIDFDAKTNPAKLINNADWLRSINYLDFLRDIGKGFTINSMIRRDSVRSRMDREGEGMSYTEFSYALLQAYDYLVLYERENCNFQSGGTDQWGNILDGIDLIRRRYGNAPNGRSLAHGIVFPLITDSKGDKLGKSIGGAPSLDPNQFSPYRLYQFFYNTSDADVIRYLKLFTWVNPEEINYLESRVLDYPAMREAQKRLAKEVTEIVHSEEERKRAERLSDALFKNDYEEFSEKELEDLFLILSNLVISMPRDKVGNIDFKIEKLAVDYGLAKSLSDSRRLVGSGGLYLNSRRVEDADRPIGYGDLLFGKMFIFRRGRRERRLIRVE